MSHISKIEVAITDLEALKKACHRLGFEFMEGATTYKWYGRVVDPEKYPLPEGMTLDDLGKCHHAIRVPEADYEIGVVRINGNYLLLLDYWDSKLKNRVGENGGRLKQAYAIERTLREARRRNFRITESRTEHGIRLTLSA